MPGSKHTPKPRRLFSTAARAKEVVGKTSRNTAPASLSWASRPKKLLQFRPTGPHGEDPDEGYHVQVGDKITVEIRLTVESVGYHPDRTFVLGRAEDGSVVAFDEDAVRGIFWNWD